MRGALKAFLVVAVLAVAACGPKLKEVGPPATIKPGPAAEAAIEKAMNRYSALLLQKDAAGLAEMYTPDGVMERQSGAPLHGREEIRAFLASFPNVKVLSNEMRTLTISYNGPAAVQAGEFQQSAVMNGKTVNASGRFEATWVRGPHGEWFIQHMSTRPAPTASATPK